MHIFCFAVFPGKSDGEPCTIGFDVHWGSPTLSKQDDGMIPGTDARESINRSADLLPPPHHFLTFFFMGVGAGSLPVGSGVTEV